MNDIFLNQIVDTIRTHGFVTFANPVFAQEIMATFSRPEFKEIRYVGGVGKHAVEGYIYLPRARKEIAAMIKRQLAEVESHAASYRLALAALSKAA